MWLNRIYRNKNKFREKEDCFEIVLSNPDTEREVVALIDKEDYETLKNYKWRISKNGYVVNRMLGYLHRVVMKAPDNMDVDHIFHNKLDNRKSSLRICTRSQNNMNKGHQSNSHSKVRGVFYCKQTGRWASEIRVNGNRIWLGRFDSFESACAIRLEAEKKYFGNFKLK